MLNIKDSFKAAARKWKTPSGLLFDRPLVLLQSDDWGRVGVRDREGFEELQAAGIRLGEQPYDFYSLETAEDVDALREVLSRHSDSIGRHPCLVMNFVVANVDFPGAIENEFREIRLKALVDGLPGKWSRPGLHDAYRRGITDGVFYPALHGTTHFCRGVIEQSLAENHDRARMLQALWKADTPYIYWRMPWIGYEYWDAESKQFLNADRQAGLIRQSAELFRKMFGKSPRSACAPGYRANNDTRRAWEACGIRVAQNGSGGALPIHFEGQILNLYRNVDFEPATDGAVFSLEKCLQRARQLLDGGNLAVISIHSINFHSALRDFRTATLNLLNEFLLALEAEYPNLLYVHDEDVYRLANTQSGKRVSPIKVDVASMAVPQIASGI